MYGTLCRITLARILEPLIIIGWPDRKADQSLHLNRVQDEMRSFGKPRSPRNYVFHSGHGLVRASLPGGGRALTLYEGVYPQRKFSDRRAQERFLERLAALLPPDAAPAIIADAGS